MPLASGTCSVSDRNKLLLLQNPDIWTHLRLGLFADLQQHPRGPDAPSSTVPTARAMQEIWQRNYAETMHQLALFSIGRDALREQALVLKALEEVAERGITSDAREHAQRALMALSDKEPVQHEEAIHKHIMISYQWHSQVSMCVSLSLIHYDFAHSVLTR